MTPEAQEVQAAVRRIGSQTKLAALLYPRVSQSMVSMWILEKLEPPAAVLVQLPAIGAQYEGPARGGAQVMAIIERAANAVGGGGRLARRIKAPLGQVRRWRNGHEPTPQRFLDAMAALTTEAEAAMAAGAPKRKGRVRLGWRTLNLDDHPDARAARVRDMLRSGLHLAARDGNMVAIGRRNTCQVLLLHDAAGGTGVPLQDLEACADGHGLGDEAWTRVRAHAEGVVEGLAV